MSFSQCSCTLWSVWCPTSTKLLYDMCCHIHIFHCTGFWRELRRRIKDGGMRLFKFSIQFFLSDSSLRTLLFIYQIRSMTEANESIIKQQRIWKITLSAIFIFIILKCSITSTVWFVFEQLYYNNDDSHGTKKVLTEGDLQLYNLLLCGPEKRIKIRPRRFYISYWGFPTSISIVFKYPQTLNWSISFSLWITTWRHWT